MTETKRKYTKEFKIKAVELSNIGGAVKQVATELDIPEKNLGRWRQEFKLGILDNNTKIEKPKSAIELENIALKKANRETQLENDILKKTITIFTKKDR